MWSNDTYSAYVQVIFIYSQITFELDSDVFSVDSVTGYISTTQTLNREVTARYIVVVTATDDDEENPLQTNVSVTIDVADVNDNSPVFPTTPSSFRIPETLMEGEHVTTITASDADEEGTENSEISFNITGGSGTVFFNLDPQSGNLTVAAPLDYETNTSFELVIEAYDGGNPVLRSNKTFTIRLRNEDDNEPEFVERSYNFTIRENNLINDLIGQVRAEDLDPHNRSVGYSFTTPQTLFAIDRGSGNITARSVYNLEELSDDGVYDEIEVRAFYLDEPEDVIDMVMIMISITDEDEFEIVVEDVANIMIFENANVSDTVGMVDASDDDANSSLQYSLSISGDVLAINAATGNISVATAIDRESSVLFANGGDSCPPRTANDVRCIRFIVRITELTSGDSVRVSAYLLVRDLDDEPPEFTETVYYYANLSETTDVGFELTTLGLSASDPDIGVSLTYDIPADQGIDDFSIETHVALIEVAEELNYERTRIYNFTITANDTADNVGSATVVIDIFDENDNTPEFVYNIYTATISEGSATGVDVETVNATDEDSTSNAELTYRIAAGNVGNKFDIDPETGLVTLEEILNREDVSFYSLTIEAIDGGSPALTGSVLLNISVNDTDDHPPAFVKSAFTGRVLETAAEGENVLDENGNPLQLSVEDPDVGSEVTISVHGFGIPFDVDPVTGNVTVSEPLDAEIVHIYQFIVIAQDNTDLFSHAATVTITVTGTNDHAPQFEETSYDITIEENSREGEAVLEVVAEDLDRGDSVVYTLQTSFNDSEVEFPDVASGDLTSGDNEVVEFSFPFELNNSTGEITLLQTLDHEAVSQWVFNVTATDRENLSATVVVTVDVEDLNDNTPRFDRHTFEIDIGEDAVVSDTEPVSNTIRARDLDSVSEGNLRYFILSGARGTFEMDRDTGDLYLISELDPTEIVSYELELLVTDGEREGTAVAVITVIDINNNSPVFAEDLFTFYLLENSTNGTLVGEVEATDNDLGDNQRITYSLTGGEIDAFYIDNSTGEIFTIAGMFNADIAPYSYQLTVTATDNGGVPRNASASVEISLVDVNDNAPEFDEDPFSFNVAEDIDIDESVFQVTASDADSGENEELEFEILTENSSFSIDLDTGIVRVSQALDFDNSSLPNPIIIEISATDKGSPPRTTNATLNISITDTNDNAPYFTADLIQEFVAENTTENTTAFIVRAFDRDSNENGRLSYVILDAIPVECRTRYRIVAVTGEVILNEPVDAEEREEACSLLVRATDNGTPQRSTSATYNVLITDINENAPEFIPQQPRGEVAENSKNGTSVLTLETRDGDGDNVRYSAVGGATSLFDVSSDGLITVAEGAILDREDDDTHEIIVEARDDGTPRKSTEATVTITVTDENDSPPLFDQQDYYVSVRENLLLNEEFEIILASDGDIGTNDDVEYRLVDNSYGDVGFGKFSITPETGQLFLVASLDFETEQHYYLLRVQADDGVFQTNTSVHIRVLESNDITPMFGNLPASTELPEDAENGTVVYNVSAMDNDLNVNGLITYTLMESEGSEKFSIDPYSGVITVNGDDQFDFDEGNKIYELTVVAMDNAGGMLSGDNEAASGSAFGNETLLFPDDEIRTNTSTLTVEITDVNDNPPVFTETSYNPVVVEHDGITLTVIRVTATDADEPNTPNSRVNYGILSGSFGKFDILPNGDIISRPPIDREVVVVYYLLVIAYDSGSPSMNATINVTITVHDSDDERPVFTQTRYTGSIQENSPEGVSVLEVRAVDRDTIESPANYSLQVSDISNHFVVNTTTGVIETSDVMIDREANQNFTLVAQAGDISSVFSTAEVFITVVDVNDEQPVFQEREYSFNVSENQAVGTRLQRVRAIDRDSGPNAVTIYELVLESGRGGLFDIDSENGDIIVEALPCFSQYATETHVFTLHATDSLNSLLNDSVPLTISLYDENRYPPVFIQPSYVSRLDSLAPTETEVLPGLRTTDKDVCSGDPVFEIIYGNTNNTFEIDGSSGRIILTRNLTADDLSFTLTVQATDTGNFIVANRTATVSVIVLIGQLLPVSVTVDPGLTTLPISRLSQVEYVQEVWLHDSGGSPANGSPNLTFSLGTVKNEAQINVVGAEVSRVRAALARSDVYPDEPEVVVGVQVEGPNFGRASVKPTEVFVRVVTEADSSSRMSSCVTAQATGSCVVSVTIPTAWFTSNAGNVSVYYGLSTPASELLGYVSINNPESCDAFTRPTVRVDLPSKVIFPGTAFNVDVYAHLNDSDISYYSLTFDMSDGLEFVGVNWYPTTHNIQYATHDNVFLVTATNTASNGGMTGERFLGLQFRLKSNASIPESGVLKLDCNVEYLVTGNGEQVLTDNPAVHVNFDEDGQCNVPTGKILIVSPIIVQLFPYTTTTGLLNTAYLSGVELTVDIVPYGFLSSGEFSSTLSDLACESEDENIVKVDSKCSYVYLLGNETSGAERVDVTVMTSSVASTLSFQVWFPGEIDITFGVTELSPVQGVFTEDCSDAYESTPVTVQAVFISGAQRQVATITPLVADLLTSTDETVLVLEVDSVTSSVRAVGEGTGEASVTLRVNDTTIASNVIDVLGLSEGVDDISFSLHTGLSQFPLPPATAGESYLETAKVELLNKPEYLGQPISVLAEAVLSNGRNLKLTDANGLILESTNKEIVTVTSWEELAVRGGGSGLFLKGYLDGERCPFTIVIEENFTTLVEVNFQPIREIDVSIAQRTLATPQYASLIELPTNTSVEVHLVHEDETSMEITEDERTSFTSSGSQITISSGGILTATDTYGPTNITVTYTYNNVEYTSVVSMEVIAITDIEVTVHPYPSYSGSSSVEITSLNRYPVINETIYQRAWLQVTALLSNGGSVDISNSDSVSFSSSNTSILELNGTIARGLAPGNVTVTAELGSLMANASLNLTDTILYITAITDFTLEGLDGDEVLSAVYGSELVPSLTLEFSDGTQYPSFLSSSGPVVEGLVRFSSSNASGLPIDSETGLVEITGNRRFSTVQVLSVQLLSQPTITSEIQISSIDLEVGFGEADVEITQMGPLHIMRLYINAEGVSLGAVELELRYNESRISLDGGLETGEDVLSGSIVESFGGLADGRVKFSFVTNDDVIGSDRMHVASFAFRLLEADDPEFAVHINILNTHSPVLDTIGDPVPRRSEPASFNSPTTFEQTNEIIRCSSPPCTPSECEDLGVGTPLGDVNADCVFDVLDVLAVQVYAARATLDPDSFTDGQLEAMDADKNGRIDLEDAKFLLSASLGRFPLIADPMLRPIDAEFSDCVLSVNITLDDTLSDNVFVFFGLFHKNESFGVQYNTTDFTIGTKISSAIPSGSYGGWSQPMSFGGGVYGIETEPSTIAQTDISFVVFYGTVSRDGRVEDNRIVFLTGPPTIPLAHAAFQADFDIFNRSVRLSSNGAFNGLIQFDNSFTAADCYNNDDPMLDGSDIVPIQRRENIAVNTTIRTVSASDEDSPRPAGDIAYSLRDVSQPGTLAIDPESGEITIAGTLDRESYEEVEAIVVATDQGPHVFTRRSDTLDLFLQVIDVNDNPPLPDREFYTTTVSEAEEGVAFQLSGSDADIDADNRGISDVIITYNGSDIENIFDIETTTTGNTFTASLVLVGILDFEERVFYNLTLEIFDGGSPALSSEVYIELYVTDANDSPPEFTSPDSIVILENNGVGVPVIELKAEDADTGSNAEFTFEIISVHEADDDGVQIQGRELTGYFRLQSDESGNTLLANRTFNREGIHSFSVEIAARDAAGFDVQFLWVMVCEENDNPPMFPASVTGEVDENSQGGTLVTTLRAPDLDAGAFCERDTDNRYDNVVEYRLLTPSDEVPFVIDRVSGNVSVNGSLDYEEYREHVLEVMAYDLGSPSLSSTANLTISVVDLNDNPPILNQDAYVTGAFENSSVNTSLMVTISAMDRDSGDNRVILFNLTGEGSSDFSIDPDSGVISVAVDLDRDERQEFYYLTVIAYNPNDPSQNDSAPLNITVFDINDNEPVFDRDSYFGTVGENSDFGTSILTVLATDADEQSHKITYRLETDLFEIDVDTGVVSVNGSLCVPENTSYTFIVVAEDRPVDIVTFTNRTNVTVLVEDDNPNAPQFVRQEYGGIVADGVTSDEPILTVSATDLDVCSPPFKFYIVDQPPKQPFRMDEDTGILYTNATLRASERDFYTLTISTVDTGTPTPLSSLATVYVVVGETVPVDINVDGGFPVSSPRGAVGDYTYEQQYDFFYDTYMANPQRFSASYRDYSSSQLFQATPLPASKVTAYIMTRIIYYDNRTVMAAIQALDKFNSYTLEDTEVYMIITYDNSSVMTSGITTLNRGSSILLSLVLPEVWFTTDSAGSEATVEFGISGEAPYANDSISLVHTPNFVEQCANFTSQPQLQLRVPSYTLYKGQVFKASIYADLNPLSGIALTALSLRCTLDPGLRFLLQPFTDETPSFVASYRFENRTSRDSMQFTETRVALPPPVSGMEEVDFVLIEVTDDRIPRFGISRVGISCTKYEALTHQQNTDPFSDLLVIDQWGCHDDSRGEVTISIDKVAAIFPSMQQTVIFNDAPLNDARRDFDVQLYGYVLSATPYPTVIQNHIDVACFSSHPEVLRAEYSNERCRIYVDGNEVGGAESVVIGFILINSLLEGVFEIPSEFLLTSISVQLWHPQLPLSLWAEDSTLNPVRGWMRDDGNGSCLQAYQTSTLAASATFTLGENATTSDVTARVEHLLTFQSSDENVVIILSGLDVVGLALGEANITASSSVDGRLLGETRVSVLGTEVCPVEVEIFHGVGVETILPSSIPYRGSAPFQVRLDPGLQYETQTAQLVSSVLFSDGTRYWVSDLVQYSVPTNSSVIDLQGSEVAAIESGTGQVLVDWTSCNDSNVISRPVPLPLTLHTPEVRISISHSELALPTDAASLLDYFPISTSLTISLVYSINGDDITVDITDNSLTNLVWYPESAANLTLRNGNYIIEPLSPNTTVSFEAQYRSYTSDVETLSILEALEVTLVARHYPTYSNAPVIQTLRRIGNTGSFQRAILEATLSVAKPDGSAEDFDVSTSPKTTYDITVGPAVSITGNIFAPRNVGSRSLVARFGEVESNMITLNVESQDVTVTSIDTLELSTGNTLSGEVNTIAAQLLIGVTLSDGSRIENAYVDRFQVVPALFTVVIAERAVARITVLSGDITLLGNAPAEFSLTVIMNDRIGLQASNGFFANLEPSVHEIDLGSSDGAPVDPISLGEAFTVPVYINTGSTNVGVVEVGVAYSSSLLNLVTVVPGVDWMVDSIARNSYFGSSENEFDGFVHFGGLLIEPHSGLLHIANMTFTAGDSSGVANIKAEFITYQDISVPPVDIPHPSASPAANIAVLVGLLFAPVLPDLDIPFQNLDSDIRPCTNPLPCDCDAGKETGDINGDCVFNLLDVASLYYDESLYLAGHHSQENLRSLQCLPGLNVDYNLDGVCSSQDVHFLLQASFWQVHFVPKLNIIPVNRNDCFLTIEADLVSRGDRPANGDRTSLLIALYDRNSAADTQYSETTGYLGLGTKVTTTATAQGSIPPSLNGGVFLASASESIDGRFEVALSTDLVSTELALMLIQVHTGYANQPTESGVYHMRGYIEFPPLFPEAVSASIHHPWIDVSLEWAVATPLLTINQMVSSSVCINDNKPRFYPAIAMEYVFENATPSVLVGTVFANDSDAEENTLIRYSISRIIPNDAEFYINETSGEVFLNSSLDRERTDRYDISVHAEDQGNFNSLGGDGELVVHILDINDNNPIFEQSLYYTPPIPETAMIESFVFTVRATDEDKDNMISYSLPNGGKFSINSTTGDIRVGMELDYENETAYELLVLATDQGGRSGNATVIIEVEPVNDNFPMCPESVRVIVLEDANVGSVFHTVTVSDADVGSIHRDVWFELLQNGTEFGLNKTSETTADILTTVDTLTFDGVSDYPLVVVATDVEGYNCTASVTVVIGEASTLDFQISGAGFAIGRPTKSGDSGFDQQIAMFGSSLPSGTVTVSLGDVQQSATYYRNTPPVASLTGILITPQLSYDAPLVRVAAQAKDSTLNTITGAAIYLTAQPTNDSTLEPATVVGQACETEPRSGSCMATLDIPQSWFSDRNSSTVQITAVSGEIETNVGEVVLNPRPSYQFDQLQNLIVQFPSHNLFSGQSFPIRVGAPLGNDIIAFELTITLDSRDFLHDISTNGWHCLTGPSDVKLNCLRDTGLSNADEDVIFPGEKFLEIRATHLGVLISSITISISTEIHTVVSRTGPAVSTSAPATVIDYRGMVQSPANVVVDPPTVLGYLPYAIQAEVILVHSTFLSLEAYALRVTQTAAYDVELSLPEFECMYGTYNSNCADLLDQFSSFTSQGSEETVIWFNDTANGQVFSLPLRVWYPFQVWYEVSDPVLNLVSIDCSTTLYQQTSFRVFAEYTTGERVSPILDVTRFNIPTLYNSTVFEISNGTIRGVGPGSSDLSVQLTTQVFHSGTIVSVTDDVITPLVSFPIVFTELDLSLSQDTFDRNSTLTATAASDQIFNDIGIEGRIATAVYYTDGSRYVPPVNELGTVSLDVAVATTDSTGIVTATGSGATSVSIEWILPMCPVLIQGLAPVIVKTPYPVQLVVSPVSILGESKDIPVTGIPLTAIFDIHLIYSDNTEVDVSDIENIQFSTSQYLNVVYDSVTDSITVSTNASSTVSPISVEFWYRDLTTAAIVTIVDVERLQASLFPYPNAASVQDGVTHMDLEQIGSTGYWQRAELVVEAVFSDGTIEQILNPSITSPGVVSLMDNMIIVPIPGSFGTNNIITRSGLLQSTNNVSVTVLDQAISVENIQLELTEIDRTQYTYIASVTFEDGTRINDVTNFTNDIGEELVTFNLIPETVGSIDVSSGIITITQSHYDYVDLVATVGDITTNVTFAANLEPSVGQLDLGAASGVPIPRVTVGESFTFDVRIHTDASPIKVLDVVLTYNTTALQLVTGSILNGFTNLRSHSPTGEVQLTAISTEEVAPSSNTVHIASVTFRALTEGLASFGGYRYILVTTTINAIEHLEPIFSSATLRIGSSTARYPHPQPTPRDKYLPPTTNFDYLDTSEDGNINILDAFDAFMSLAAGDSSLSDTNWDMQFNIRDIVYLTRVTTGLAPVLSNVNVPSTTIAPECLLTFRQTLFYFADMRLYAVISHPNITLELSVSQPINSRLIASENSGSGVFTTLQTTSSGETKEFILQLYTPLDIRDSPVGFSLIAETFDDFGWTDTDRRTQFIGGQTSTRVGQNELISQLTDPYVIGERSGFNPLTTFTVSGLRSDYCSFNGSVLQMTLYENETVNSIIYTVSAVREDLGFPSRNERYSIAGQSDPGVFSLTPNGSVVLSSSVDYETQQVYSVSIEGETSYPDGTTAIYSALLEIAVVDKNDESPVMNVTVIADELFENVTMGTVVAVFEASDREAGPNGEVYFQLESSSDPFDHFILVQNRDMATLSVNSELDHESIAEYNLIVKAIDRGVPPLSAMAIINITVLDINDNAPKFSESAYTISVPEETLVWNYTIDVVDPDAGINGEISLTLIDGPLFSISNEGVLTLVTSLDRESNDSYTFTVIAKDGGSFPMTLPTSATVTVIVTDINDNSPILSLIDTVVPILVEEDSLEGTVVAQFSATDRDEGTNSDITFQIGEDGVPFRIDPSTGVMTLAGPLDVDTQTEYVVTVIAQDGGEPPRNDTLSITIYAIEGQVISFDASKGAFLVGEYTKFNGAHYSQPVGYLIGRDIGSPVPLTGDVNIDTVAEDIVQLPNIGATVAYVRGALLQSQIVYSQKTVVAFVQAFDSRDVIAEPTAIRVRVMSDVASTSVLEESCTTSPDLGYCIIRLDVPDSWFSQSASVASVYANTLTVEEDGTKIDEASIISSPAETTDFSITRVLLVPPAHDILSSRSFMADVYVVSPITYEGYNRVDFDVQVTGAEFLSVSTDKTWECSKLLSSLLTFQHNTCQ